MVQKGCRLLFECLLLLVLLSTLSVASLRSDQREFDWKRANISVAHSANAYCDPTTYLMRPFKGQYLSNFVATYAISNSLLDVEGYVGYDNVDQAIYVVFRGSFSWTNYLTDMVAELVPYEYCSDCFVHEGFYEGQKVVVTHDLLGVLSKLHKLYPTYPVIFTGHSLGGALATLCALRIFHENIFPKEYIQLITFGSPRVGNSEFAQYASQRLTASFRVTHHQDVIPHLPPVYLGFLHIATEWYQPADIALVRPCESFVITPLKDNLSSGLIQEDEGCSSMWFFFETSTSDHYFYLGQLFGQESCILFTSEEFTSSDNFAAANPDYFIKSYADRVDPGMKSRPWSTYTLALALVFCLLLVASFLYLYLDKVNLFLNLRVSQRLQYIEIPNKNIAIL